MRSEIRVNRVNREDGTNGINGKFSIKRKRYPSSEAVLFILLKGSERVLKGIKGY